MKRMNESLRIAAEIRENLKGRHHSDSTELVAKDRNATSDDYLSDREFMLKDLVSGVTKKNRHPEIDFGAPVGNEEW